MLRPFPSSMRAAATTPAEPAGACVARCPAAGSLPRISGGSASASPVSRPARRSLALRPAWSLSRPRGPSSSECFGRYRYLHHPLRLLPAGATVAGRDSHPLGNGAFARRTEKCGLAGTPLPRAGLAEPRCARLGDDRVVDARRRTLSPREREQLETLREPSVDVRHFERPAERVVGYARPRHRGGRRLDFGRPRVGFRRADPE